MILDILLILSLVIGLTKRLISLANHFAILPFSIFENLFGYFNTLLYSNGFINSSLSMALINLNLPIPLTGNFIAFLSLFGILLSLTSAFISKFLIKLCCLKFFDLITFPISFGVFLSIKRAYNKAGNSLKLRKATGFFITSSKPNLSTISNLDSLPPSLSHNASVLPNVLFILSQKLILLWLN